MALKNNEVITGTDTERSSAFDDNQIVTDSALDVYKAVAKPKSTNTMEFKGQVAVITGAASGIGLAISRKLLTEGARLALLDINEKDLKTEFKKFKTRSKLFPVDVTQQSIIDKTIKEV